MSDSRLECPKCDGELETKTHEEISVQRCNSCCGLLIEAEVVEKMQEEFMIEKFLDIGSVSIGKKYDKIQDIECPLCKIEMVKIEDPRQAHIWLESCPVCYRIFFDAGEFTDLNNITISDMFKRFLKGSRHKH